jgi:hypothetical protein
MLKRLTNELAAAVACLRHDATKEERAGLTQFAASSGMEIVAEFHHYDDGKVSDEASLISLLKRADASGASIILVDTARHLGDSPIDQAVAYVKLKQRGFTLVAADSPFGFTDTAATAQVVQKVLDSSLFFDRAIDAAVRGAKKKRQRLKTGDAWRKTYAEMAPRATLLAKRIYQESLTNGRRITLREISARLAEAECLTSTGVPFHPEAVRRMLKGPWPRSGG